ncbi:MAG: proton-conducting transporter membrane subunit [Nannocystaceae bacterium]
MSEASFPYATVLVALPLLAALGLRLGLGRAQARRWALLVGIVLLVVGLAAAWEHAGRGGGGLVLADPWVPAAVGFGVSGLGAILLPFGALIGLAALLVLPRGRPGGGSPGAPAHAAPLARILVALALTQAIFAAQGTALLAALWCVSLVPPLLELRALGPEGRPALRIFAVYLGLSAATFVAGVILVALGQVAAGAILLGIAVMIRKGITPLHSWVPAVFERAPLGMSVLFSAPQVGAYATALVVFPLASARVLQVVGLAALLTALYGAAMAVGQRSARRAYGYFFLSQSALVMVGFECTTPDALTGGLCVWISSGLALAGLGLTIGLLEGRRGRLRLDQFHGGYERMPRLGGMFLLLGAASVGFPGTLGFVGEELLAPGALDVFPIAGAAVAVATALNGITVLRMFFALFCGRPASGGLAQRLRPRETLGLALLGVVVVVFGLWPGPLVQGRARVAASMLAARAEAVDLPPGSADGGTPGRGTP